MKAVSVLIATVILVAFAVSAAIIIMSFSASLAKSQTESVSARSVCASKGALFIDSAVCARVRDTSLAGYWKFDSVNSTNYTLDSSGYGNDGMLFSGSISCFNATGCISLTAGQINNGLQFDGVNDYANVTSLSNMGLAVELWKKGSSDTIWYHLVNSSGTLYVNGAVGSGQIIPLTNSTGTVIIGRDSPGNYFSGTIDEVKIYNRFLSADEISQHYQKGLERFAVDGYHKTIKTSVRNIGTTELSNLTIFADINGRFYLNNTPLNGGVKLPPASEPVTLEAYTYYDGPIKTLKVSVISCPISMTLTNDSTAIGTC